jgi:hypothetical protein
MKIAKGTFAPTYSGVWSQFSSASLKLHKFWFHVNDMNCCVSNTMHKYMLVKPTILEIWHVQKGTNLTQDEIKPLELQVCWVGKGHGCPVNTYIMSCNMSYFAGSLKISFISQLGIVMKFNASWFMLYLFSGKYSFNVISKLLGETLCR